MKMTLMKLVAYIPFIAVCILGCSNANQDIDRAITRQFDSNSSVIDLGKVEPSAWDRVCFISPYASNESTERTLGFKWDSENLSSVGGDDTIYLIVFIKDNKVIAFTDHSRGKGDFSELKQGCLLRTQAILKKKRDASGWVQLVERE